MQHKPTVRFLDKSTPPHLMTLIMLAGMSAMVMNMFLPSLPNMTEYFHTEYRLMQLSVALFLGVSAVLQILIGPISDSIGRRPVLLGGLALFLLATLGCIFAPSAEVFLFFRMCQAVVAVAMVLSRAVIRDLYDQNQSASMIGIVTMFMSVVPMISPAIGGLLDEWFGWKANFWAFFVIGAITLWVVWSDLGETATSTGKSLGAQFREYPELLRSPRFWGYSLASGLCSGSFFAYLGGAPFVGSVLFHMSPSMLGLVFGAPAIGYMAGNALTGVFATRLGVNRLVLAGCLSNFFGVFGSLLLFLMGYGSPWSFFGMMTFVGLGNGLTIPNATAGMLSVRPRLAGTASGLGGSIQIGGGAILSGLVGTMLTPESGAFPLLYMMTITAVLALASIGSVYWRERQIAPAVLPD
ncbi:multidrug effflux MFS transporter [Pseudosulfitobacter sp. DSM 107133]|uniref:multidrug effflux MFS transporter n=1 Tax=Pseudosulfitobacter sp. DSM 107133 TaxID=2883100 RepID=UPI000DF1566A|nr:multidrug effflux MFS transporter [Pseudosulfitobacter sp. DSM 107133]UOA26368.1 Bicyclomycin resistance protein [Pseudosulfitobacter sp. DSM 107133]